MDNLLIVFISFTSNILINSIISLIFSIVSLILCHTLYFLRNDNNYVTVARRTQIFAKSFIPSSIELWNNLDDHIRYAASLNIFKSRLKEIFNHILFLNIFYTEIEVYLFTMHALLETNVVILMRIFVKIIYEITHFVSTVHPVLKMPNITFLNVPNITK
jgi:hypothetical protein